MMIVFAISITPSIVFHDLFAGHTDTIRKSSTEHKGVQISKKLFNCHCDNIVAESPFTEPAKLIFNPSESIFAEMPVEKKVQFISSSPVFYSLRGPPAV